MRVRRWIARTFFTRVTYVQNGYAPDECWEVERPDWWQPLTSWSSVTSTDAAKARAQLDEWQDDMAARRS